MFTEDEKEKIIKTINATPGTIYLGCDSSRFKKEVEETGKKEWHAKFVLVLIIHVNDSQGCKIFHTSVVERNYDQLKKPTQRLMRETQLVVDLFHQFEDILIERNTEIHLDISTKKEATSNKLLKYAYGYVYGTVGIEPKFKNETPGTNGGSSWAASFAADRFC